MRLVYIQSPRLPADLPYREFYYPLNVFMHVLTQEEGDVAYLHYGLFEEPNERIAVAQERSTALLLQRLPKPPARLLEVGIGLGTTLKRLTKLGYRALGITPDDKQFAVARARHGKSISIEHVALEDLQRRDFDVVFFQESAQYIESWTLFAKCAELSRDVIVLDEFSTGEGPLHRLDEFLSAAAGNGFVQVEDVDVSQKAAPTVDYFMQRFDRYRQSLVDDLGITSHQVDELIASGHTYRDRYANGTYVYRLMRFTKQ